jgi:hypothetical protein
MVNVFTTVVIAIASAGLGYIVGWLVNRSTPRTSEPVQDHMGLIVHADDVIRHGEIITVVKRKRHDW